MTSEERKAMRQLFYEEGKTKCFYCSELLTYDSFTLDHKISLFRGGEDHVSNIVPCCYQCNFIKGKLTDSEFIERGGRGNRTLPFGDRPSYIDSKKKLIRWAYGLPEESRTRQIVLDMNKYGKVDIRDYPPKEEGDQQCPSKIQKLARRFKDIIGRDDYTFFFR